jgi:hypothetical protein
VRLCVLSLLLARLVWPFSWFSEGKVFGRAGLPNTHLFDTSPNADSKSGRRDTAGERKGTQDVDSFDRGLIIRSLRVFFVSFGVPAAGGGIDAFFGVGFSE